MYVMYTHIIVAFSKDTILSKASETCFIFDMSSPTLLIYPFSVLWIPSPLFFIAKRKVGTEQRRVHLLSYMYLSNFLRTL